MRFALSIKTNFAIYKNILFSEYGLTVVNGKKQRFYLGDTVKMMSRLQIVIEIMAPLFEVKNCISIKQIS